MRSLRKRHAAQIAAPVNPIACTAEITISKVSASDMHRLSKAPVLQNKTTRPAL